MLNAYRSMILRLGAKRTVNVVSSIKDSLIPGEFILDIGSGSCDVVRSLTALGFCIIALDVKDKSCVSSIRPILF